MQQLSRADNGSLFAERHNVYNHVGALLVYDVTTAPGGKVRFRDILRHFDGRLVRVSADLGGRILAAGRDQLPALARGDLTAPKDSLAGAVPALAPVTRVSRPVSRNRVMEAFGLPLSRIKLIRNDVPGVTLNDVFVSVAGGAVRKYLERHGELPDSSLSALMPISLRTEA